MNTPRFTWEINLGQVINVVTLLGAGFLAYLSIEVRIAGLDQRTSDYAEIRDIARGNDVEVEALRELVRANTAANAQLLTTMSDIRENVASMKATLEEQRRSRP